MKHLIRLFMASLLAAGATACADAVSDGNDLYRAGRYDDAILRYGDAQGKGLDPAMVQFNIGDAQYRRKKFDEAAAAYERAFGAKDPLLEAKARYNIGNCRYRQGKLPEALEAYKKTIELVSGDEDLGAEGKKVLADAQANYEFVQNKMKENAKSPQQNQKNQDKDKQKQQQQQSGGQNKDQQQAQGDQKEQQQPQSGKDQQKQQGAQDQKEKEQQQKDSQKSEKEGQAQNQKQEQPKDSDKKEKEKQAQARKDKTEQGKEEKQEKQKVPAQPVQMSKEEAEHLLNTFGQFEERQKIQDKFHADEPRPAKDW